MDISVEHEDNFSLVAVRGSFDSAEIQKFRDQLLPLVEADNARLLIDLSEMSYIMSEGLGQFVNLVVEGRKTGSRVVFYGLTSLVETVIGAANLDRILRIADSQKKAIEELDKPDE